MRRGDELVLVASMTFKTLWRNESDQWTTDGEKISDEKLAAVKEVLIKTGPILVQHWFYRGGRAPQHVVFDQYDEFIEYLQSNAKAGDAIDIWNLELLLRVENTLIRAKCAAEDGTVPKGGAY
jgi:hypothetical protein